MTSDHDKVDLWVVYGYISLESKLIVKHFSRDMLKPHYNAAYNLIVAHATCLKLIVIILSTRVQVTAIMQTAKII